MKILHFADAHIGVETYGTIDTATGLSTRVMDVLNALDTIVNYAIEHKVDLVLFCGDAYKNREPSQTHQREFAKRIRRLSEASIPTLLVAGNHDLPGSPTRANSVEIFDTLDIDYITIAQSPGIHNIRTQSGEVQVAVLPWLRRNALLVREEMRGLNVDQIMEQLQDAMTARLVELSKNIDTSEPAVLAGHFAVAQAAIGTERTMVIGRDPVVLLSNVANPVYDYIALGHIHKRQVLCKNPPVVYSGSIERLDFGDEGEDKGFYVVEIETHGVNKTTKYEFHPIEARRFLTVEINVSDDDPDPTGSILRRIQEKRDQVADAVVRLKISISGNLAIMVKENEILKALKEAYNVSIGKEIRRGIRTRASGWVTDSMTPLDALRNYLNTKNYPEAYRKKLLEYGERLINEKLSADRGDYGI